MKARALATLLVGVQLALWVPASAQGGVAVLETLREDVDRYPEDPHLRVALALEELRTGNPAEGVRILEAVVQLGPRFATEHAASLGIAYQRAGRNLEALQKLGPVVAREDANARPRIHFALALEDEGHAQAAKPHWQRLASDHPELNAEIELLRGLSAQRRGQTDLAREHLRRAIEYDYDGWVTIQAERALSQSRAKTPSGPHLELQAGLEFDSNVTQESSDNLPGAPSDSEDGVASIGLDFAWRGIRISSAPDVQVEAGYSGRQTLHFSLGELNRQLHAPYVGATWQVSRRNSLRLNTLYSFELLGSDAYRHAVGVQPSLDHVLGPRAGRLRLYGWLRRDEFVDHAQVSSLERDGYDVGGGLEHLWFPYEAAKAWMRTRVSYSRRITKGQRDAQGYRSAYDGDGYQGAIDLGVTLPMAIRARAAASVAHTRYAHRNVIDGAGLAGPPAASTRRDLSYSTSFGLSRPILDRFEFEVSWIYRDRDSNVDPYRFHGHIVGAYFRAAIF